MTLKYNYKDVISQSCSSIVLWIYDSIKTLNYIRAPNPRLSSRKLKYRKGKFLPFAFLAVPRHLAKYFLCRLAGRSEFTTIEWEAWACKRFRNFTGDNATWRRAAFLASKMSVVGAAAFVTIVNNGRTWRTTMYKAAFHLRLLHELSEARENTYI